MRSKQTFCFALLLLVCSAGLVMAQVEDTFYSKSDIEQVIVREFSGNYWVVLLLKTRIGDFDGFYYYNFANLQEALEYALWMSKGKIKGVQHYQEGSGQTGTWAGKRIAVISRWYFFSN